MPSWNKQQLKAIHTKQKNILVSASAGAGKTTVLIARLIDLVIKDRISIDHILAMTFTEAAANEMKKRLAAELTKLLKNTEDEQERQYISEQLSAVSTAHISTIHSFCLSILQEFYYVISLSATRVKTIMDPASASMMSEQAMQLVFNKQYEQADVAFYETCTMFSARPESDDQLRNAIKTLATYANAQSDPDAWLAYCASLYQPYASIQEIPSILKDFFFDYLKVQIQMYQQALQEINIRYQRIYTEETKKANLVKQKVEAIPAILDFLTTYDYTSCKDAFIAQCHLVTPTPPDKEDKVYASLRKRIMSMEDTLLAGFFDERTLLQDIHSLCPIINKLITMCKEYRSHFQTMKEKAECIDFDDMEHFALTILQANDGQVAKHYQALFDEIMVDEFQDSNDVQNMLVKLICRKQNVFRVGDIKQSIYGFRHALPQLMRGLIEHAGMDDEVIYLSNNYRSKKMIVDFNNELFKELMNLDGFDGSYRKEDDVETGIEEQLQDNYPIVFHALEAKAIKDDGDMIVSTNALKASYIANQILAIKQREQRKWKDFVVLVRANARKEDLKQVFDELKIPYFIDVKSGFYQSSAVQIMLATLQALLNPHDEINFTACMMSPLFQIDVQSFSEFTLAKEKEEDVYSYLLRIQHPKIELFEDLRKQLYQIGICDMLTKLFELESYYQTHTSMQERTNLDLLFDNASIFESEEGKGILAFMKSIDAIQDIQSGEAIPIGSEEDVVRVMSIHQSKGLQFPVVFLWSNSKQTPIEFKELFVCDSTLGIGLKHMDLNHRYVRSTIFRQAIEHKKDREELEEEMRILYVATTRAQQQMHIVDCIKSLDEYDQPLSTSSVYERGGYTSWILSSLLKDKRTLFHINPVNEMWHSENPYSDISSKLCEIPRYVNEDRVIDFTSPSTIKQKEDIPTLSFDSKKGAKHGSLLHHIIETETINDPTRLKQAYPQLQDTDIYALQQLSQNTLYQTACSYPEVHHELAYMVKVMDTIQHGLMDFVAISENDIILIDFKSDHLSHESLLVKTYKDQIHAYQQALQVMYPTKQVHAYIYSLYLHKDIVVDCSS